MGIQSRSRKVSLEYQHGGKSCPHLAESQACNEDKECPIDCVVSAFGPWTSCSQSCSSGDVSGKQSRQREETTSPEAGGKACAHKEEKTECNSQGCTCAHVYCVVQPGSHHIKVMHHKLEWAKGGRKHRCKFNYDTQNCECMCYNDVHWSDVKAYDTKGPCASKGPTRLHAKDRDPTKEVGHLTMRGISEVGSLKPCEDSGEHDHAARYKGHTGNFKVNEGVYKP